MAFIPGILDLILHLDVHLNAFIQNYGMLTYFFLFLIVFLETALVITPFLPGDSLLFAAGALSSRGALEIGVLFGLLSLAAVMGDTINYQIGQYIGPKVFTKESTRVLNKKHLDRTHAFYTKHGGKTILLARFIPIIRTFAPFIAGIGQMRYWRFVVYNIIGGLSWVGLFTFGGYYFGNIPFVKEHFSAIIIMIIILSLAPVAIEVLKHRRAAQQIPTESV